MNGSEFKPGDIVHLEIYNWDSKHYEMIFNLKVTEGVRNYKVDANDLANAQKYIRKSNLRVQNILMDYHSLSPQQINSYNVMDTMGSEVDSIIKAKNSELQSLVTIEIDLGKTWHDSNLKLQNMRVRPHLIRHIPIEPPPTRRPNTNPPPRIIQQPKLQSNTPPMNRFR
jgi:hypothetical protein